MSAARQLRHRPIKPVFYGSDGTREIHGQTLRQFSPSDVHTLRGLPDIEVAYRHLRNAWLTCNSAHRQAEERVIQAERAGHPWEIEDARAMRARYASDLGWFRRVANMARGRAEAELFLEFAEKLLPPDTFRGIRSAVEDMIGRPYGEMGGSQSKPTSEDYKALDGILARWGPSPTPPQEPKP